MRHRLLVVLVLCAVAAFAGSALAADVAPTGRWVSPAGGASRVILSLYTDGSYVLTSVNGEKVAASVGKYTSSGGHLVLTSEGTTPSDFGYVLGKGTLTLTTPDGKSVALALDRGPAVGTWHSDQQDTTWTLGADGSMKTTEGGKSSESTWEVIYDEPTALVGDLYVHQAGSATIKFHFSIEQKGSQLVLGGGPEAKDPGLRVALQRVGAAPDVQDGPAPATAPTDAPKRPKFPSAPKLPGGGGTTPGQPTVPVTPAPGTAPTPTPAPETPAPAPAGEGGLTWDTAAFATKGFKILKTNYDADGSKVTWVLEATRDITGYPTVRANFYDADDIKIWDGTVSLSPSLVSKGEKVRGELTLPYREKMKLVVKVVLIPG